MVSCNTNDCNQDLDCGDHGDCRDFKCSCDVGWFGNCCTDGGDEDWGALWQLFRIVFAVAFFALSAFGFKQFVKGMMLRRSLGCRLILLRLFKSPRNLSVALIVCATFLRGLWLCIDPLSLNEVMSRLSDRMLYNIVFPLMYSVYCCVLLVWSGLYQGVKNEKELWSRVYRNSIVVMMCISFCLGISFSACQGMRITKGAFVIIAFIAICVAVVFILFGLLCFGLLLNKHIKSADNSDEDDDSIPKPSSLRGSPAVPEDSESVELVNFSPTDPSVQVSPNAARQTDARVELKRSTSISLDFMRAMTITSPQRVRQRSVSSSSEASLFESGAWSCESATPHPSALESESGWSEFDSVSEVPLPQKEPIVLPDQPKPPEHEDYVVVLTQQDKIILRQIILLSLLSAVIGVSVVGLTVLTAVSRSVQEPKSTLVILYLVSGMEFFAYVSVTVTQVLLIFATTIKVKSKENLHFVSEVETMQIALRISKNPGTLVLPPNLHVIARRLHKYACVAEDA